MKIFLYTSAVILLFFACSEDRTDINPFTLHIEPHNSNNEFYAGIPVNFQVKQKEGGFLLGEYPIELYVDGNRAEGKFSIPGSYTVKAFVKMSNSEYEFDTVINVVKGPPVFGNLNRGEKVLFGWKAGESYKALLGTYHGSSALDYEVLSIDKSLVQQGSLTLLDLDSYPEIHDHGASPSGTMVLAFDHYLVVYDDALNLKHRIFFNYSKTPRKIFVTESKAVLMFDSLSYINLKQFDLNTGNIVKGPTQFFGIDGMTVSDRFFLDESKIAAYYVDPTSLRTLVMGVQIGGSVEFNQYFQPPIFVQNVIPISSGGYIINTHVSEGNRITVLGADKSKVVKWTRIFDTNSQNYGYQPQSKPVVLKECNNFIYVFFDNMRCVKLSLDGQLIWDKYFYPRIIVEFEDVIITTTGEFIMLGTHNPISNEPINPQLHTDIVCIKINEEGFRVDL